MKKEKPAWAYDLHEIMTPELAEELGHAVFRAWTGQEPPPKDADDAHAAAVAGNHAV